MEKRKAEQIGIGVKIIAFLAICLPAKGVYTFRMQIKAPF